jgi:hypothetical protein
MIQEWNWFNGAELKPILKMPKNKSINYHELAKDKKKLLEEIKNNPNILFTVVDSYSVCMCGGTCGNCLFEERYFIQLIIQYKSIVEKDIVDIKNINLFKLTSYLPFSIYTLKKYEDTVDWNEISKSYLYPKSTEFIKLFWNKIDWKLVSRLYDVSNKDIINFVFIDNKIPINFALTKTIVPIEYLKYYIDKINLPHYIPIIIKSYGPQFVEEYDLVVSNNYDYLFVENCCKHKYIPKKQQYIDLLKNDWFKFISYCEPTEEFIDNYIAPNACNDLWEFLSGDVETYYIKHSLGIHGNINRMTFSMDFINKYKSKFNFKILMQYQKFSLDIIKELLLVLDYEVISKYQTLTPEFIDEHANNLDWYSLCEFQELPDWLLRKHLNKINWGQVSLYQKLTPQFIEDFQQNINDIKLKQNKKIYNINDILYIIELKKNPINKDDDYYNYDSSDYSYSDRDRDDIC